MPRIGGNRLENLSHGASHHHARVALDDTFQSVNFQYAANQNTSVFRIQLDRKAVFTGASLTLDRSMPSHVAFSADSLMRSGLIIQAAIAKLASPIRITRALLVVLFELGANLIGSGLFGHGQVQNCSRASA
jgi:hypothetical protein